MPRDAVVPDVAGGAPRHRFQHILRANTAIDDHEIVTEIDRYIAWPGQATDHYLGQLTIEKLRAEAEDALGESFAIRDFHDFVLSLGNVPLTVLEDQMRGWVAARLVG